MPEAGAARAVAPPRKASRARRGRGVPRASRAHFPRPRARQAGRGARRAGPVRAHPIGSLFEARRGSVGSGPARPAPRRDVSSSSRPRGDGPPRQRPSRSNDDAWQGQLNLPALSSKSTPQPRCGQTVENALIGASSTARTSQQRAERHLVEPEPGVLARADRGHAQRFAGLDLALAGDAQRAAAAPRDRPPAASGLARKPRPGMSASAPASAPRPPVMIFRKARRWSGGSAAIARAEDACCSRPSRQVRARRILPMQRAVFRRLLGRRGTKKNGRASRPHKRKRPGATRPSSSRLRDVESRYAFLRTFAACSPFGPSVMSNSTSCPSLNERKPSA